MWKTLQDKGKNHGHRPATTFYYFVECLHNAVSSGGLQSLPAAYKASRRWASASLADLAASRIWITIQQKTHDSHTLSV